MDIQNKRISDAEFEALRQEVLTQWPTGKDVYGDIDGTEALGNNRYGCPSGRK